MSSESKYFDSEKKLTEAGKKALGNLLEIASPEEIDALLSEESEEPQSFTNGELQEKIGLLLRLFHQYHIKENIREYRFEKFSAWLNRLYQNGCSRDDLISYFNLAHGRVLKKIDLI